MEPDIVVDNYQRVWRFDAAKLKYFMIDGDGNGLTFQQLHDARGPVFTVAKGKQVEPVPPIQNGEMVEFSMADVGGYAYGTVTAFDEDKQFYILSVQIARSKVRKTS